MLQQQHEQTIKDLEKAINEKKQLEQDMASLMSASKNEQSHTAHQTQMFKQKIQSKDDEIRQLQDQVNDLEDQVADVQSQLTQQRELVTGKDKKTEEMRHRHKQALLDMKQDTLVGASIDSLREAGNQNAIFDFDEIQQELDTCHQQMNTLDNTILQLKTQLSEVQSQKTKYEEMLRKAEDSLSHEKGDMQGRLQMVENQLKQANQDK